MPSGLGRGEATLRNTTLNTTRWGVECGVGVVSRFFVLDEKCRLNGFLLLKELLIPPVLSRESGAYHSDSHVNSTLLRQVKC